MITYTMFVMKIRQVSDTAGRMVSFLSPRVKRSRRGDGLPILSLLLIGWLIVPGGSMAAEAAYPPAKVVYDVSAADPATLDGVLDRALELQKLYGNDPFEASIYIVLHEGALPLFSSGSGRFQSELVTRAESLALGEIVQFRLCEMSARQQGLKLDGFPDFAPLVPMADAEIVRLQQAGYAYLR